MKVTMALPDKAGTFGVWIQNAERNSDVHVYVHEDTHEGTGVIIGCNPNPTRFTDPGLILTKDGKARLQFSDKNGEAINRDVELATVHDAILAMLNGLKAKLIG